ncbi:MAG: hypothetical protein HC831_19155 [Chloroflexia bacterium]|nr:hypothetical protein [Chloroflexia bacterium]
MPVVIKNIYISANHKFNAKHWLESGVTLSHLGYDFTGRFINPANAPPYHDFSTFDDNGNSYSQQAFTSLHSTSNSRLSTVIGLHLFRFSLTGETSIGT